jgi:hypothetical protein
MNGIIRRQKSQPWGTPGKLTLATGWSCDTLELPWAGNQRGISCTKADSYHGWIWRSPTMGRDVIRLENKNGRFDCLIHNGNFAGDQIVDLDHNGKPDFLSNVHGCTLVGTGYGMVQRPDGKMQFGILKSKDTLTEFLAQLGAGPHVFHYMWELDCKPGDDV